MMSSYQNDCAIELFQLDNLIDNHVPFLFFALLKQTPDSTSAKVEQYMKHALIASEVEIKKQLKTKNKDVPVILICEDGKRSGTLSTQLQKKGFTNVFFIEGGFFALSRD